MLGQDPKTSLFVRCCGVPAVWAGERKLWEAEFAAIRKTWEGLGRPTLVLACPTCRLTFETYLPEIPTEMLYDLLAPKTAGDSGSEAGMTLPGEADSFVIPASEPESPHGTYAVFDPCASRAFPDAQESVRRLAAGLGFRLTPLPDERAEALCCGYGGHSAVANPEYTRYVSASRAAASAVPYIAYCANCRDILRASGKRVIHILDAVLDLGDGQDMDARARARADREPPTVTERQENRRRLKRALTKGTGKPARPKIRLTIPEDLRGQISREFILESDLASVVAHCEKTGMKTDIAGTDLSAGCLKIGHATYWVEYRRTGRNAYELTRAYQHRMEIGDD
jgi:hypothetical protein